MHTHRSSLTMQSLLKFITGMNTKIEKLTEITARHDKNIVLLEKIVQIQEGEIRILRNRQKHMWNRGEKN
jgi:hypothetical protein